MDPNANMPATPPGKPLTRKELEAKGKKVLQKMALVSGVAESDLAHMTKEDLILAMLPPPDQSHAEAMAAAGEPSPAKTHAEELRETTPSKEKRPLLQKKRPEDFKPPALGQWLTEEQFAMMDLETIQERAVATGIPKAKAMKMSRGALKAMFLPAKRPEPPAQPPPPEWKADRPIVSLGVLQLLYTDGKDVFILDETGRGDYRLRTVKRDFFTEAAPFEVVDHDVLDIILAGGKLTPVAAGA